MAPISGTVLLSVQSLLEAHIFVSILGGFHPLVALVALLLHGASSSLIAKIVVYEALAPAPRTRMWSTVWVVLELWIIYGWHNAATKTYGEPFCDGLRWYLCGNWGCAAIVTCTAMPLRAPPVGTTWAVAKPLHAANPSSMRVQLLRSLAENVISAGYIMSGTMAVVASGWATGMPQTFPIQCRFRADHPARPCGSTEPQAAVFVIISMLAFVFAAFLLSFHSRQLRLTLVRPWERLGASAEAAFHVGPVNKQQQRDRHAIDPSQHAMKDTLSDILIIKCLTLMSHRGLPPDEAADSRGAEAVRVPQQPVGKGAYYKVGTVKWPCMPSCCTRVLRAICPQKLYLAGEKTPYPHELMMVRKQMKKLWTLVQLGFGQAGERIIARSIGSDGLVRDLSTIRGSKVDAIFGFCDIRNFTDVTECLQEQILPFVCDVAAMVHHETQASGGAPNKNIGDAFLLVWKLPRKPIANRVVPRRSSITMSLADKSPVAPVGRLPSEAAVESLMETKEHLKLELPIHKVLGVMNAPDPSHTNASERGTLSQSRSLTNASNGTPTLTQRVSNMFNLNSTRSGRDALSANSRRSSVDSSCGSGKGVINVTSAQTGPSEGGSSYLFHDALKTGSIGVNLPRGLGVGSPHAGNSSGQNEGIVITTGIARRATDPTLPCSMTRTVQEQCQAEPTMQMEPKATTALVGSELGLGLRPPSLSAAVTSAESSTFNSDPGGLEADISLFRLIALQGLPSMLDETGRNRGVGSVQNERRKAYTQQRNPSFEATAEGSLVVCTLPDNDLSKSLTSPHTTSQSRIRRQTSTAYYLGVTGTPTNLRSSRSSGLKSTTGTTTGVWSGARQIGSRDAFDVQPMDFVSPRSSGVGLSIDTLAPAFASQRSATSSSEPTLGRPSVHGGAMLAPQIKDISSNMRPLHWHEKHKDEDVQVEKGGDDGNVVQVHEGSVPVSKKSGKATGGKQSRLSRTVVAWESPESQTLDHPLPATVFPRAEPRIGHSRSNASSMSLQAVLEPDGATGSYRQWRGVTLLADNALAAFVNTIIKMHAANEPGGSLRRYLQMPSIRSSHLWMDTGGMFRIKAGFGLHIGWAVEGAIGSSMKVDASYLSPSVNVASRLESATRFYGVDLLMSKDFAQCLSMDAISMLRRVDRVKLKGVAEPMELYAFDWDPAAALEFLQETQGRHSSARFPGSRLDSLESARSALDTPCELFELVQDHHSPTMVTPALRSRSAQSNSVPQPQHNIVEMGESEESDDAPTEGELAPSATVMMGGVRYVALPRTKGDAVLGRGSGGIRKDSAMPNYENRVSTPNSDSVNDHTGKLGIVSDRMRSKSTVISALGRDSREGNAVNNFVSDGETLSIASVVRRLSAAAEFTYSGAHEILHRLTELGGMWRDSGNGGRTSDTSGNGGRTSDTSGNGGRTSDTSVALSSQSSAEHAPGPWGARVLPLPGPPDPDQLSALPPAGAGLGFARVPPAVPSLGVRFIKASEQQERTEVDAGLGLDAGGLTLEEQMELSEAHDEQMADLARLQPVNEFTQNFVDYSELALEQYLGDYEHGEPANWALARHWALKALELRPLDGPLTTLIQIMEESAELGAFESEADEARQEPEKVAQVWTGVKGRGSRAGGSASAREPKVSHLRTSMPRVDCSAATVGAPTVAPLLSAIGSDKWKKEDMVTRRKRSNVHVSPLRRIPVPLSLPPMEVPLVLTASPTNSAERSSMPVVKRRRHSEPATCCSTEHLNCLLTSDVSSSESVLNGSVMCLPNATTAPSPIIRKVSVRHMTDVLTKDRYGVQSFMHAASEGLLRRSQSFAATATFLGSRLGSLPGRKPPSLQRLVLGATVDVDVWDFAPTVRRSPDLKGFDAGVEIKSDDYDDLPVSAHRAGSVSRTADLIGGCGAVSSLSSGPRDVSAGREERIGAAPSLSALKALGILGAPRWWAGYRVLDVK